MKNKEKSISQAVILAGGFGSRLSEETHLKPKPMLEIGGRPILWHIMKMYAHYGITEFIICCGYKSYVIKEYFNNYLLHHSNVTFDFIKKDRTVHERQCEPWRVTLVDTGENTMTGGRVKRIEDYIRGDYFCLTYGDGVGNINITRLIDFHFQHGKIATVTAVQPPSRFGAMKIESDQVVLFQEKPLNHNAWINGGFFVLNKAVFEWIDGDTSIWESDVLVKLSEQQQLMAYQHSDFWAPMDTLRDKHRLEELWNADKAYWKVWEDR